MSPSMTTRGILTPQTSSLLFSSTVVGLLDPLYDPNPTLVIMLAGRKRNVNSSPTDPLLLKKGHIYRLWTKKL